MKFDFAGTTYFLEFQRNHRTVKFNRQGTQHIIKSKYPYTTVRLLVAKPGEKPGLIEEATVGCCPADPYSNELGRIMALRKLTKPFSKELRRAVWQAYQARRTQGKQ